MIFVGLGNPDKKYFKTRHNIGFRFVDKIAEAYDVKFKLNKDLNGMIAEIYAEGVKHILLKPITYMNNSGIAVIKTLNYYKAGDAINLDDLIIVYDDMDLSVGKLRIRKFGSSGGHNGMKSIIQHVNCENFKRIRVGIGHPQDNEIDYVLGKFSKEEEKNLASILDDAPNIFKDLAKFGIDYVMNHYNN